MYILHNILLKDVTIDQLQKEQSKLHEVISELFQLVEDASCEVDPILKEWQSLSRELTSCVRSRRSYETKLLDLTDRMNSVLTQGISCLNKRQNHEQIVLDNIEESLLKN